MSEFHKDRELEHMFELQGNNRSGCPDRRGPSSTISDTW